jgi:hypothetical protein
MIGGVLVAVPIIAYLLERKSQIGAVSILPGSIGGAANSQAQSNFGPLEFVPDPRPDNPEAIKITNGWAEANVVSVPIPQLGKNVAFHRKCADQLVQLFSAWDQAGLIGNIITWEGSWNPRFVRGSKTNLSNHAFATAFDINAKWNPMGTPSAAEGEYGNVQALASIAKSLGWRWGGDYVGRPDGMHFERLSC